MSSLVLELQRDCLNPSAQTADLLRKALVIAQKLNVPEFTTWLERELTGYQDAKDLPKYRIALGEVAAQDRWGNGCQCYSRVAKLWR